jgi:hypothetical protein
MSRTAYKLNAEKVKTIKKALWLGVPQGVIASKFDVSQAMISRISHGDAYSQEPWPDGTTGQLRYSTLVIDGIDFHSIPPGVGYHADVEFTKEVEGTNLLENSSDESRVIHIDSSSKIDTLHGRRTLRNSASSRQKARSIHYSKRLDSQKIRTSKQLQGLSSVRLILLSGAVPTSRRISINYLRRVNKVRFIHYKLFTIHPLTASRINDLVKSIVEQPTMNQKPGETNAQLRSFRKDRKGRQASYSQL